MRNRFYNADAIWNGGASNPRAVARTLVEALCNYTALRMPSASVADLSNDELLEQAAKMYVEDRYSNHEEQFRQYKLEDRYSNHEEQFRQYKLEDRYSNHEEQFRQYKLEDRYSNHEEQFRQYKLEDKIEDFKALRGLFIAIREAKPTNSLENSA